MLEAAGDKCVILLDAHVVSGDTLSDEAGAKLGSACPLAQELDVIFNHAVNNHLILIDDVDLCGTHHLGGITMAEVLFKLHRINPLYKFGLVDGIRPKMLLVAAPPGCDLPALHYPPV